MLLLITRVTRTRALVDSIVKSVTVIRYMCETQVVAQPAPEKKKQEPVPVQEAVAQKVAEPVQEQAVQQQQEQPVQQAVQQEV